MPRATKHPPSSCASLTEQPPSSCASLTEQPPSSCASFINSMNSLLIIKGILYTNLDRSFHGFFKIYFLFALFAFSSLLIRQWIFFLAFSCTLFTPRRPIIHRSNKQTPSNIFFARNFNMIPNNCTASPLPRSSQTGGPSS